jgi:hypothetical protein
MSVTSPDLSIELAVNSGCTELSLEDTTGIYSTAPNGYGLPGGPAVNDVTGVAITATYSLLGITLEYVFTVLNGTITAATLSVNGATAVDILSALASTVWPFTTIPFVITDDYGPEMPEFTDDIVSVTYEVSGTVAAEAFSVSTSARVSIDCNTTCCRDKKFINLDPNCGCNPDALIDALYVDALLKQATYSAQYNYTDRAVAALQKATEICDGDCGCS